MQKPILTVKGLIGTATLTIAQAITYLDHQNYKLRDSEMVILNDDLELIEVMQFGTLNGINEDGEVSFIANGGGLETVRLGAKKILIIFPINKPKQAVFYQ
ncbi:MAG: hypothetical protein WCI00_02035 [bacterium]